MKKTRNIANVLNHVLLYLFGDVIDVGILYGVECGEMDNCGVKGGLVD